VSWLLVPADARAGDDRYKRLVNGAFFSQTCRQRAAEIGFSDTTNVDAALEAVAAFGRRPKRPGVPEAMLDDACEIPAILLINLLRLNGVDADLVEATRRPRPDSDDKTPSSIQGMYVYVPKYDRYLDPEISIGKQGALDSILHEEMVRSHLQGPTIGDDSGNTCSELCLTVRGASGPPPMAARRVKTERIRRPLSDAAK